MLQAIQHSGIKLFKWIFETAQPPLHPGLEIQKNLDQKLKEIKALADDVWALANKVNNKLNDSITSDYYVAMAFPKNKLADQLIGESLDLLNDIEPYCEKELELSLSIGYIARSIRNYQRLIIAANNLVTIKTY